MQSSSPSQGIYTVLVMNNPEAIRSIWKDLQRLQANITHFQMVSEHHRAQHPWGGWESWTSLIPHRHLSISGTQQVVTFSSTYKETKGGVCSDHEKDGQPFSPSVQSDAFDMRGTEEFSAPMKTKGVLGMVALQAAAKMRQRL